jgi:hypothetical protein
MTRSARTLGFAAAALIALAPAASADVRVDDKTLVKFEGTLGRVMNLFGGKATRDGVKTTIALKGDRKATLGDTDGMIVDLAEEKVYLLDMKKKTYTMTTFAEMRRRLEEARQKLEAEARKAEAEASKAEPAKDAKPEQKDPQVEVDFDVKETGARKTLNGFDTRQVVMTITMREKGKTLEQAGGLVITSDMWIAPTVPQMKELIDFEIRYARAMQLPETFGASAEQMQAALAAHPMLKQGLERMSAEGAKMDGTTILTTMTMEAVKSAEQLEAEQRARSDDDKPNVSGGVGGIVGGFARRAARRKTEGDGPKPRATFMTITNEHLSITSNVGASDVAMPAGFKEGR